MNGNEVLKSWSQVLGFYAENSSGDHSVCMLRSFHMFLCQVFLLISSFVKPKCETPTHVKKSKS